MKNGCNFLISSDSNSIKQRILSHFRNKQSRKALELRNSISDISFEETGNELIALLLESDEIKKLQPFFNHAQKRIVMNHCIQNIEDENGYLTFRISKKSTLDNVLAIASSYDHAIEILDKLIFKFNLCQKHCGAEKIAHTCFRYSVKQCNGACIGKESPEEYNKRARLAAESLQFKNPNFMIIGMGRSNSEKSVVQIEKGKYVGYGYFDSEFINPEPEILKDFIKYKSDNRDVSRIIRQHLLKSNNKNILIY